MKRIALVSLLIIFTLNAGCSPKASQLLSIPKMESGQVVDIDKVQPGQADETKGLDEAISTYLEEVLSYKSIDGKSFEAHELYGFQKKDGKTYAYLWALIQEYNYADNTLQRGSGTSLPVVVVLTGESGAYTPVEYKAPKDGEQYAASIKELFPAEYQEKILTRTSTNGLEQIAEQKAENYFSMAQDNIKLEQEVKTAFYKLDVPGDWTVDKRSDGTLLFKAGEKILGGLELLMHYSNQPISSLFPNHSEIVEQKELTGFPVNVYRAVMKLSQPATSNDKTVVEQVHYYFLVGEYAYDLYFNTSETDSRTALAVARTFTPIGALDGIAKDGDIITGAGIYTGQIDNNSIEIKLTLESGKQEDAAFRLSEEADKRFADLGLKTGDAVKISYTRNGYDQLVISEIEKAAK